MVATDVAARGLDIPHIRTVINFDFARDIETHTHRIGRTGRAGVKGSAYTLMTEKDKEMAGHLVRNLEQANQDVPKELMNLAMKSAWFKNSRFRKSGKSGLGFSNSNRPSFGLASTSKGSDEDALSNYLTSKESSGPKSSQPGVIGQGRVTALKSAFKSQYLSRFCKSEEAASNTTNTISATDLMQMPPPPPPFGTSDDANSESGTAPSGGRKRKSRWE